MSCITTASPAGIWGALMPPDVIEDIQELQQLLQQSKRPRVQSILALGIQSLQQEAGNLEATSGEAMPMLEEKGAASAAPAIHYSPVTNFSWEQEETRVKIYLPFAGASKEKVRLSPEKESFDLKIHDLDGKNFQFGIPKLHKQIDPEESFIVVKPKRLIVNLKKKVKSTWPDLHFKEQLNPKDDEEKNPMQGIMDIMKEMYKEGDDNTKKTIAQAWTDARSGKKKVTY